MKRIFNQTIYVKVLTNNQCFRSAQIELKIGASAIDESFLLKFSTCETSPSIEQDGIKLGAHLKYLEKLPIN